MDFKCLTVLVLAAICQCVAVQGNSLEVSKNVTAIMGHQATLSCKYTSPNIEDLIFIRWIKNSEDGADPIAMRRMPGKEKFIDNMPLPKFQDHVILNSTQTSTSVSLDMIIQGLKCSDIGLFECQAMGISDQSTLTGVAQLNIEVHPGTPQFSTEELQVTINSTFDLACEANVGTPPQMISFSYKEPGSNVYTLITDGVTSEITPTPSNCDNVARSSISLTMTEEMDNSNYMCTVSEAILGPEGTPKNFDEILLKVYREKTTTTTTEAPPTTMAARIDDSSNRAASSQSYSCWLFTSVLLTARLLTNQRIAS